MKFHIYYFWSVNVSEIKNPYRRMKSAHEMVEGEKVVADNFLDDYYPNRPNELERYSPHNIFMYFR